MLFTTVLPIISALTGLSLAQSIDPSSIDLDIRQQWCTAQQTSCPLLCLQYPGDNAATTANDCDAKTLDFDCVCWNGQSPNASQYSQTIPYFECTEFANQCVTGCGQDNACSSACRSDHPCGAQNPKRVNTSTITSTHSKTATSGSSATGSDASATQFATLGGSSPSASGGSDSGSDGQGSGGVSGNSGTALMIDVGRTYGLALVLGGVFAGFALVL
ncbi:hypothetical protein NA57DRAFT_75392 [Rhizodiscina lignyota]|uniref:DUF7707 domain-containing protein n=1 Tax=Rhizodiscina lignyota TaxID=1504668 RepID=A0A9P4IIG6_9PEZI|nr:hypothetical protein NA57DRAFT_75392 [Rhizodiscina lignyota]